MTISVWWLSKRSWKNRYILQSNHISLTLSHTKYQMTNGWFMTMSLRWSKTSTPWTSKRSLSHLSALQYDQGVTYALCTVHCPCALYTSVPQYVQGVTYALQGLKSGSEIAPTLKCPTMPSWPAAPMKKLELCSWRLVHDDQRRRELVTEVVVFIIATLTSLSHQRLYCSSCPSSISWWQKHSYHGV